MYYDLLNVVSLAAIFCGLFVIITKNPIVSVLFLIGLFLSIATYLMMLGIHFIGLSYLLVYVGAVSILFLFILMLINVRISELVTDNNNSVPLALMIGILFSSTLYYVFPSQFLGNSFLSSSYFWSDSHLTSDQSLGFAQRKLIDLYHSQSHSYIRGENLSDSSHLSSLLPEDFVKGQELYFATTPTWDGALVDFSHITTIGNVLYTVYPIWLIITSLILLLAMVGAIVITIKQ